MASKDENVNACLDDLSQINFDGLQASFDRIDSALNKTKTMLGLVLLPILIWVIFGCGAVIYDKLKPVPPPPTAETVPELAENERKMREALEYEQRLEAQKHAG